MVSVAVWMWPLGDGEQRLVGAWRCRVIPRVGEFVLIHGRRLKIERVTHEFDRDDQTVTAEIAYDRLILAKLLEEE